MAMRKREDVVFPNAAAVDVGASSHWAAVPPHRTDAPVREFGAMTDDLNTLADLLLGCGVDVVALESTGVYWIPVYEVLEQRGLKVWLVDARQVKYVPGRKSDVQDCQWLQRLMSYGLLRAAFRPGADVCVLRAVARQREVLLTARWANAARLSRERDQEVVPALPSPRPGKAMREDSTIQVTAELPLHVRQHRRLVTVALAAVGEPGLEMLLQPTFVATQNVRSGGRGLLPRVGKQVRGARRHRHGARPRNDGSASGRGQRVVPALKTRDVRAGVGGARRCTAPRALMRRTPPAGDAIRIGTRPTRGSTCARRHHPR